MTQTNTHFGYVYIYAEGKLNKLMAAQPLTPPQTYASTLDNTTKRSTLHLLYKQRKQV